MIKININKKLHGSNGNMNLDINLNIKENNFVSLSGESGSGGKVELALKRSW